MGLLRQLQINFKHREKQYLMPWRAAGVSSSGASHNNYFPMKIQIVGGFGGERLTPIVPGINFAWDVC